MQFCEHWFNCQSVLLFHQLRDCDMGAIVNRDLQQRIRPVNGVTNHQQVAKSDIKNAAKIIQNFDNRWNLWDEIEDSSKPVIILFYFLLIASVWHVT